MQKKSSQKNLFDNSDSPNGDGKRRELLPFTDFCHYFNTNTVQLIVKKILFGFYVDSSVPFRDKSASFTKAGVQNMLEVCWAAYSLPLLENCETPELNNASTVCFTVKTTCAFTIAENSKKNPLQ